MWLFGRVLGCWKNSKWGRMDYSLLSQAAPGPGREWMRGGKIVLAEVIRAFDPTLWNEFVRIVEILRATVYDPLVCCHLGLSFAAKKKIRSSGVVERMALTPAGTKTPAMTAPPGLTTLDSCELPAGGYIRRLSSSTAPRYLRSFVDAPVISSTDLKFAIISTLSLASLSGYLSK